MGGSTLDKKEIFVEPKGYRLKKAESASPTEKPGAKPRSTAEIRLEARRALFEKLVVKEGQTAKELWEDSPLTLREIEEHLKYLENENFLDSKGRGSRKRYFPKVSILVGPVDKKTMEALSTTEARRSVLYLMSDPGKDTGAIADALELDPVKVSRALSKLERAGIVTKIGKKKTYSISPEIVRVAIKNRGKKSFLASLFSRKNRGKREARR